MQIPTGNGDVLMDREALAARYGYGAHSVAQWWVRFKDAPPPAPVNESSGRPVFLYLQSEMDAWYGYEQEAGE